MTQELIKELRVAVTAMVVNPCADAEKRVDAASAALLDRLEKADALVKAIKTDRHDWEDWPDDSREAFRAMEASK